MRQFKYKAVDMNKKKFTGIFLAEDEDDLSVQLAKQGLYLVSAKPYAGGTPSAFFTIGFGGVKTTELSQFCRQYSIMIHSGISILEGLEILKEQAFSSYFRKLLQVVYEDVKGGEMLSDAFEKHKRAFPSFFRNMIRVGEKSGKLVEVFQSLSDYYERDVAIKKKTRSAMAYPSILLVMTIGIVILMLVFVVPTFRESLSQMEVEITGITKAVYDISDFFLNNWLQLFEGIVIFAAVLFLFSKTQTGKYAFDWMKVNLPMIGTITTDMITARFARCFSLLLSSGMDIAGAMDAVQIVFGNKDVEKRFQLACENVKNGIRLADSFAMHKLFPPMMIQMVAVGERTASLDEILTRSSGYFDDNVETSLNSLVAKIQPILLGILGGIIGMLFIAVYSPMLAIMQNLV